MGGYGYGKKARSVRAASSSAFTTVRRLSESSAGHMTAVFFEASTAPTHAQSQSWISQKVKTQQQFERTKKLLSHFAPEQYRPQAKPTKEPANIVPRTHVEMAEHHAAMKDMALQEAKKNLAMMEAKRKMSKEAKVSIKLAFNGKTFLDSRSSVMSQCSIWATHYEPTLERPLIQWPGAIARYEDGEKRENVHAPTRCGRFLPPLRHPDTGDFIPEYPIDQVGPVRALGPTPAECKWANDDMDNDRDFERVGGGLLGDDIYSELGSWQAPFVPDWLAERRNEEMRVSGQFFC